MISQQELNEKIRKFIQKDATTLKSLADFHFEDSMIKLPMETKDGKIFEATFCYGYKRKQFLAALSVQIGCPSRCKFCQLGEKGLIRNLTDDELMDQLNLVLKTAYKRNYPIFTTPLKLTYVMGGEPLANNYIVKTLRRVKEDIPLKLKISTIFPQSVLANGTFKEIVEIAKDYPNIFQFQISLNSTDEKYRQSLCTIPLANFKEIRQAAECWFKNVPNPRKINLTFTISEETPLDPDDIIDILPPSMFAVRLRPWVPTKRGERYGLKKIMDSKFKQAKKKFEDAGYCYIPGAAGEVEYDFKLAPGEILKIYPMIKNGGKQNDS
ncbi:radical SAM protein [Candidatus Woesearchaeota archaeon]|nr:radical SAM protein [Candidatus Woesearchaeota archaeon]